MKSIVSFEGYDQLSDQEKKVFEHLCEIDNDSIWGIAIRSVCKAPNVLNFRRLICQLKSQDADNSEVMQNILGPAYNAVIGL